MLQAVSNYPVVPQLKLSPVSICLQRSVASEQARHADRTRPCSTYSATLATARVSPIAEAATIAPVDAANGQMPVSNSSNSSACCMPSFGAQAGPSYDINASAQIAEQLLNNNSPRQAQAAQYNAPFPGNNMPGSFQPRKILPDSVVQSLMASVFDDVDSGRHQQAESELPQSRHGRLPMHRHGVVQQDSLPSAYRSFFPAEDPPMLQSQQQLREYQLTQLLPPQLQGRQRPQHAPQQHVHQQPGHDHQQMSFSALGLQQPVNGASPQRMPSDMQHWPSPVSQHASPGSSVQAHRNPPGHQQIKLEDLDLSGLKRDYSSFTGPTSQSRQPRPGPAPRRALSFTHGSPAIAASTAANSAARRMQGVATSSQANTNSRLSTPAPNVISPADTDASLSDSDDMSGSDSGGVHIKRRRLVKGKRGRSAAG